MSAEGAGRPRARLAAALAYRPAAVTVMAREMREIGRQPRTYWLRMLSVALPAAVVWIQSLTVAGRFADREAIGRELFWGFAWCELLLVCLLLPALTAGLIGGRTERRCIEVLLTTPSRAGRSSPDAS